MRSGASSYFKVMWKSQPFLLVLCSQSSALDLGDRRGEIWERRGKKHVRVCVGEVRERVCV